MKDVHFRLPRRALSSMSLLALSACTFACNRGEGEEQLPEATVSITSWASRADTLPGEYSRVVRPAEFWDSILIVPDVRERLLWKVDLVTGERWPFGSRGSGPGEYPTVSWALKVHGDSVAIVQGWVSSPFPVLSVASGKGRTHRALPMAGNGYADAADQPRYYYADTLGHLYAARVRYSEEMGERPWPATMPLAAVPTLSLFRVSTIGGTIDTIGFVPVNLKAPEMRQSRASGIAADAGPYSRFNSWLALADGRAILANGGSYVLEVVRSTGVLEGPWTMTYPTIAASARGYQAYAERTRRSSAALTTSALTRANVAKAPPERVRVLPTKPVNLPPLNFAGIREMHAFGDVVWIPVHMEDPPEREVWDVVNFVTRRRMCRVALARNQRLLLVTANGAYVAALDDWDLERILRYLPTDRDCAQ